MTKSNLEDGFRGVSLQKRIHHSLEVDGGGRGFSVVAEEVPGFAVLFVLVAVVAGTDPDGDFLRRYLGGDDVPDVFRDDVDGEDVEVGLDVAADGNVGRRRCPLGNGSVAFWGGLCTWWT